MKRVVVQKYRHFQCCASTAVVVIETPVDEETQAFITPAVPRCVSALGAELYLIDFYVTSAVRP